MILQLQNRPRIGQETEQLSWLSIISWIIRRCGWKNGIESLAARPGWRLGLWSRLFEDMNIWRWTSKLQQETSATSRIQQCGVAVSLAWQERIKSALALGKKMQEVRWTKAEAGRLWIYLNIARVMAVRFGPLLQNGHITLQFTVFLLIFHDCMRLFKKGQSGKYQRHASYHLIPLLEHI